MALAGIFDPDAALVDWKKTFDERKQRAAQHLLSALLNRMPVKTGKMSRSAKVKLTNSGFLLIVEEFYSYFVDQGHRAGRDVRRATSRTALAIAKELRRARKETGDLSLKDREKQYRKLSKEVNKQTDKRRMVPGVEFVKKTLDAERDTVIAILAGNA